MSKLSLEASLFGVSADGQLEKSLNADKMRHHILECLGMYVALFIPKSLIPPAEDNAELEKEVLKSKLFLSAVRDIAASALVKKEPNPAYPGGDSAISQLVNSMVRYDSVNFQLQSDDGDWLPLHWAGVVRGISADYARAVLEGFKLVTREGQASALHYAASSDQPNYPVIKEMTSPCSFLQKDSHGMLPIHWAAEYSKDVMMLQYLIEQCPSSIGKRDKHSRTPLQCLVYRDHFDTQLSMVSYLAEGESMNPITMTEGDDTVLHTFLRRKIIQSQDVAVFHELLRFFPDAIKVRDADGALPLHVAVMTNNCWTTGIVQVLLEAYKEGAAVVDHDGKLPIHWLFKEDAITEERLTIMIGANPVGLSARTTGSENLMHCAVDYNTHKDQDKDDIVAIIHKLHPTAAESKDADGNFPLHLACQYRKLNVVKAVYSCYPAAVDGVDSRGWTPLYSFLLMKHDSIWDLEWEVVSTLRFLLRHSYTASVRQIIVKLLAHQWPAFVRRLCLRADPTTQPVELRAMNYAERRMAMFLIFSAMSREPPETSFVRRLRSLAFNYGPNMALVKNIVSFL